jgi:hypothetical protein
VQHSEVAGTGAGPENRATAKTPPAGCDTIKSAVATLNETGSAICALLVRKADKGIGICACGETAGHSYRCWNLNGWWDGVTGLRRARQNRRQKKSDKAGCESHAACCFQTEPNEGGRMSSRRRSHPK